MSRHVMLRVEVPAGVGKHLVQAIAEASDQMDLDADIEQRKSRRYYALKYFASEFRLLNETFKGQVKEALDEEKRGSASKRAKAEVVGDSAEVLSEAASGASFIASD